MDHLPVAEWLRSLDGIDRAVGEAVAALDHFEARHARVLAAMSASEEVFRPVAMLVAVDERLRAFDTRLDAATAKAAEVETLLAGGVAAVAGWRNECSRWRRSLEQAASDPPAG